MRCAYYPGCNERGRFTPVVEIPTVRTTMGGGNEVIITPDKPTQLVFQWVCIAHKETWNLFDFIPQTDWKLMQEAAQEMAAKKGFRLEWEKSVTITFKPVGYEPKRRLEIVR